MAAAAALTEAHRLAQLRLGRQTVAGFLTVWALLDPNNLDGTFSRWLHAVVPLVHARRSASARLAATYLSAFRALSVDAEPFAPVLAEPVSVDAVTTSMLVTGPVSIRAALGRGVPLARAVDTAAARGAGAAMRHALNGGRETIVGTMKADGRAAGWRRVTSGKACDFCSLLAGRGAVYGADSGDFAAHDHCSCSAEPVYR